MNFIAIEGLDGAGKSTQVKLLMQYLQEMGIMAEFLHFPRVETGIWGDLVAKFLRGDLGKIGEVNPYLVALIYAEDRHAASTQISTWLDAGKCVIVDRYVYSNIAFQCAKVHSQEERKLLRKWILDLEYSHFKIPQPQCTLFLDVPFSFTQKKLQENRDSAERNYLQGKEDIHEKSLSLQQTVREMYLAQASLDEHFHLINCCNNANEIQLPQVIFNQIKTHLHLT
ncbi:MAG: dTMP kinase [Bacteroidales bacterium]